MDEASANPIAFCQYGHQRQRCCHGTVKLYRNLKTGKKFLFVREKNGDYITAELNESEKAISASNRISKYGVQDMLYDYDMEADHNTGFTYDRSKGFTKTQKRVDK